MHAGFRIEHDETVARRIEGRDGLAGGQFAFPRIFDAETNRLITPPNHGPTGRRDARRKIAEPEQHAVIGSGVRDELPRRLDRLRIGHGRRGTADEIGDGV